MEKHQHKFQVVDYERFPLSREVAYWILLCECGEMRKVDIEELEKNRIKRISKFLKNT